MKLREVERLVLDLRDNSGMTLEQIGEKIGLTKQRIHQIEEKARLLVKLSEMADENPILKLSRRAQNVLSRMGIKSIHDMAGMNYDMLRKENACGEKTADEIIDMMIENGIRVGISYQKVKKKSLKSQKNAQ